MRFGSTVDRLVGPRLNTHTHTQSSIYFYFDWGMGGWVGGKALHACTDEVAAVGLRAALRIAPTVTMQMLALVTPGKQTKNSATGRTRKV